MNDKQFIEAYCHNCGSQRCEGIGTEWFEGCKYRWNHDNYDAAAEIERLNRKIMEMTREMAGRRVYVVWEYAVIEYEERIRNMGVFSSIEKAEAAIKEYEEIAEAYQEDFDYNYEEFELDTVWEVMGTEEDD